MSKTIVGSFDSHYAAQRVAEELQRAGIAQEDVGIVASNLRGDYRPEGAAHSEAPSAQIDTGSDPGPGGAHAEAVSETPHPGYATADTANAETDGGGLVSLRTAIDDPPVDTVAVSENQPASARAGAVTGGVIGGVAGLALAFTSLTVPVFGPIIAAGPIVSLFTGAGVGAVAGGLLGGLTDLGVSREHAQYYAEHLRRGGALVTVRSSDARVAEVTRIMQRHGAIDINKRAETWRSSGWEGFDESAKPYTIDELERERPAGPLGHAGPQADARTRPQKEPS